MSGARNRAEIRRLLHQYTTQLLLQTHEEAQLKVNLEAEKVLCDMVIHQQYFDSMTAALAAKQQAGGTPDIAALLATVRSAGIAGCKHQPTDGEQQLLPDSYAARLLRQASAAEVCSALAKSPQDWADMFRQLFYKLLAHLEMCARYEYDYNPASSCSIRPAPGHAGQSAQCSCQHAGPGAPAAAGARAAQHSAGACGACAAREQLHDFVHDTARLFLLGWVLNHTSVGASAGIRVESVGPGAEPAAASEQHWEQVVDRLQLTEAQELHISICFQEFKRMSGSISAEGGRLIKCVEEPTVQLAAALQELSVVASLKQQQQQHGPPAEPSTLPAASSSTSSARQEAQEPAGVVNAGGGAWHERVALRLQEHVRHRLVMQVGIISFVFNTLSSEQLALMCIASFPWQAALVYLTEIISRRVQERQERQLRQQVQAHASGTSLQARSAAAAGGGSSDGDEPAGDCVDRDSGKQEQSKLPYWRWQLQQLQRQRATELVLHQRVCWAQLGCLPVAGDEHVANAQGSEGAAPQPAC